MRDFPGNEGEIASSIKKFKDKRFVANRNREIILECEKAGVPLPEFLEIGLEALQSISGELGL